MNFLALVIIADFDDFFFFTVDKEMMADFIKEGELELLYGPRQLSSAVVFDRTSAFSSRFAIEKNKILINGQIPEEAWKENREIGMNPKDRRNIGKFLHIRQDRDET